MLLLYLDQVVLTKKAIHKMLKLLILYYATKFFEAEAHLSDTCQSLGAL